MSRWIKKIILLIFNKLELLIAFTYNSSASNKAVMNY
jgi:hypothetical protein